MLGFDVRETSSNFANEAASGLCDLGVEVLMLGLSGTEEMYYAVDHYKACAGIQITASHNPINFNGMKIVKMGSQPLHPKKDLDVIKTMTLEKNVSQAVKKGQIIDKKTEARENYIKKVLSFIQIDKLRPLKIVINCGNGAGGPTFDAIAERLVTRGAPIQFIRIHHKPDHTFPNGIPNPLILSNQRPTSEAVKLVGADMGVAFDGDFDRCFFFDNQGEFIPGQYIINLLAIKFLESMPGEVIVHDPRVYWSTEQIVAEKGGIPVKSKIGHAFLKEAMRKYNAVYGGEISAHHYFRDFAYSDSGMIPWLIIAEIISKSEKSLSELVEPQRRKFSSSSEINFIVTCGKQAISCVASFFQGLGEIDWIDGLSIAFTDWRFNLRRSKTEDLLRLNIEVQGGKQSDLQKRIDEISTILRPYILDAD